jgi:hypothetical protein
MPYATGSMAASVGGSPSGGGVSAGLVGGDPVRTPPGAQGAGNSLAVHHWVIAFYVFTAAVLISAGVIFNGHPRRV